MALEGPPLAGCVPGLPSAGIVHLVRDPTERSVVGGGGLLPVMGVHEAVESVLPDQVQARGGDPCALLIGHREFAVRACTGTVGPAKTRGYHLDFRSLRGDLEKSSRVLVVCSVPFDIIEISLRVGLKAGSIFVDVLPDATPVIETLVEVCLSIPVEIMQAGDLVPAEHVDLVIDNLEPEGLEKAGKSYQENLSKSQKDYVALRERAEYLNSNPEAK